MHRSLLPKNQHDRAKVFFSSRDVYETKLHALQQELIALQRKIKLTGKKVVIIFEGPDAAGKGGAIKRLTECLDPRGIQVHSITKPNAEEAKEHYLERFWRKLPKPGMMTIFDRSWYGRVLVERVEKMCSPTDWKRTYDEINQFEKMLTDDGVIVLKYFLDLTYNEQEKRFAERKNNPFKAWKLTNDDWRNREKWDHYYSAFKDMIRKTSTTHSQWKVIPADSKWFTRIKVISDILKSAQ